MKKDYEILSYFEDIYPEKANVSDVEKDLGISVNPDIMKVLD